MNAPVSVLILVDIQNDFLPTGALPVPHGDEVVSMANRLMQRFKKVVATQDWHPENHISFAASHPNHAIGDVITLSDGARQTVWPVHCVQNTPGAELAPSLHRLPIQFTAKKGTDSGIDSYSGFFDAGHKKTTGLHAWLQTQQVKDVYLCGLPTDYCVKATALDARTLGYKTHLIRDACRGINPTNVGDTLMELQGAGIHIIDMQKVPQFTSTTPASRGI